MPERQHVHDYTTTYSRPAGSQPAELSVTKPADGMSKVRNPRSIKSKRLLRRASMVVVLVLLAGLAPKVFHLVAYKGIDTRRYQAVYLENNSVYFGKVHMLLDGNILLTDVFRVEAAKSSPAASNSQSSSQSQSPAQSQTAVSPSDTGQVGQDIRLIKPGKELHAPDDTMLIIRSKVLFIENIGSEGQVAQAITNYHRQQ